MKGKIVPSHHGTELEEKIESKPEAVPSELWMLRARNNGKWVRSADDEESCVCQLDEESAKRMAAYTEEAYDIPCDPVRVFPTSI